MSPGTATASQAEGDEFNPSGGGGETKISNNGLSGFVLEKFKYYCSGVNIKKDKS